MARDLAVFAFVFGLVVFLALLCKAGELDGLVHSGIIAVLAIIIGVAAILLLPFVLGRH